MSENDRKKLADEYFESSYKHGNILTPEQFELASEYYERDYKEFMPTNREANILDFGCGAGHFLYHLKKKGYRNYYGVDISTQQIDYCKKNITDKAEVGDGKKFLEQRPETYDLIVAHDVMEHIPKEDVLKLLNLIFRSLRKDGILIMRVPNMSNPFGIDARYNDFTHEIGYTAKSLYQVLSISGFKNIGILPPRIIPVRSFPNWIRKNLVGMLHQFIRFCYYIQDYTVPKNLDKNLVVVGYKR